MTSSLSVVDGAYAPSTTALRYADELAALHRRLRYGGLLDAIAGEPLMLLDGLGDGLTTVSVRTSQLPERYLRGLYGFRLAEFLQTGLMDVDLAHARGLALEPFQRETGPENVHLCTIDATGRLVGYVCFAASTDPEPLALDDPHRALLPVESAHEVDVIGPFAAAGRTTHEVYEIKRLIRAGGLERGLVRARVPWHLIVGLSRTGLAAGQGTGGIQLIVGDSSPEGALNHLVWLGFDLRVTDGTRPRIGRDQLMWPSYELGDDVRARPFAGLVVEASLRAHVDVVEAALRDYTGDDWRQYTVRKLGELIERRRGGQVAA